MSKTALNNMVISPRIHFLLIVFATIHLTACGGNDFTDLQQYIANVKGRPQYPVKPLPEFKNIEPFVLKREGNLRDPFRPVEKVKEVEPSELEEPDNGIRPDKNRVKEPLEGFPLSGMKMVGTINMNSMLWGLIKGEGNTIYRVKVGNRLGKNDGKITSIDKNKIELVEIIPSKPGRFIEQSATLTLAE
ncbi:MAG: pilus assembly protein PilP [Methylococcales bacterium]|nr:pilus assembly protein PilP [Methylococcales bacterium]MDD5754347.1 pilus assembly protein PilP [Methylococcales bacterium]